MAQFQTQVNITQAPACAGDFASTNPRHVVLSPAGGFFAGPNGLTIGLFAWGDAATGTILSNAGTGLPTGFVHRAQQAIITAYLQGSSYTIPPGFGVGELFNAGDFWVLNSGSSAVTIGMKAFANNTTGAITFAATGTSVSGAIETKWYAMSAGAAGELVKMSSTPLG